MLDEVLGSYLDSLSEREFDAPFMALLRADGFYDIHFLHGPYESGKDFIAKRREDGTVVQYAVQTKAGDLDLAAYRVVRGQIDDLRRNATGNPGYDKSARSRAVLVTTGRLTGAAPTTAQADQEDLRARGETDFDIWDRERLVELMRDVRETGYPQGATGAFLGLLSAIDQGSIVEDSLESHSRGWILAPGACATTSAHSWLMPGASASSRARRLVVPGVGPGARDAGPWLRSRPLDSPPLV